MHGPKNDIHIRTVIMNVMQVRAMFRKKELTLGFSQTCLKKFVL